MDVNVTSWGEVEITAETTVTIDLEDVLNEVKTDQLIDALDYNGTDWVGVLIEKSGASAVLEEVGEEDLKEYIRENGLSVDTETDFVQGVIDNMLLPDVGKAAQENGDVDALLFGIDSEYIQKHIENHRGGFTLENVPVDDLIGALEAADALPGVKVPAEVAQAFKVASDFINGTYFDIHNGQLAGKRFIIE